MTISSTTNRVSFAGNGVTVAFATSPVVFFDSADLVVYDVVTATGVSTLKTLTTDYTVTGGSGTTGTVTMLVAPATGHTLLIVRDVAITQGSDLVNNDASDAEVIEDAFDRVTMITQQLDARIDRSFRLADSDVSGVDVELPDATTRALSIMGFDSDGDFTLYDPESEVTDDANVAVVASGTNPATRTQDDKNNDTRATSDYTTLATAVANAYDFAVPAGTHLLQGLSLPDSQALFGYGRKSILKKNANGAIVSMAKNSQIRDMYIDGDGATYTGVGVTIPATIEFDGFQHLYNLVIRNTQSYCVEYSAEFAGFCSIVQGCDFKTTDEDTTPAVKWGVESASNKHGNRAIIACTAGSGPLVDASGSQNGFIIGSMAGGAAHAGVIYNTVSTKIIAIGNRLAATAAQVVNGIQNVFTGNVTAGDITLGAAADGMVLTGNVSAGNINLLAGAKRCVVQGNTAIAGAVTDNSGSTGSNSNWVDIPITSYAVAWTGASVNPAIGNGDLTSYYSRIGRKVTVHVHLQAGTTTTFGTGIWFFSLPFLPSQLIEQNGSGVIFDSGTTFFSADAETLIDGTLRCQVFSSAVAAVQSSRPMTWATGDYLHFTLSYDM